MSDLTDTVEGRLAEAIARIGRDGFDAALWGFLQCLVQPDNLVILAYRDAGPPVSLGRWSGHPQVFAELEQTYLAGAFRLDPFYDLHLRRAADGAYRLRDIAPDAFQRSRYFLEYYGRTTLIDEIAFVAGVGPGVSLNLSLGRDAASGRPYTAGEVATCARMAPVVAALARAEWQGIGSGAVAGVEDTALILGRQARHRHGIALSPRQAEVAVLILRGHSTVSIGLVLGLSPQTVKVFRRQLYARCGISSQAELFALMLPLLAEGVQVPGVSALGRGSDGKAPVAR
jgi:DNA-binding CsgD family transcriptional regulator